jgi:hypothetical protein
MAHIRIWIQEDQRQKNEEFSCFKVLNVLDEGLVASRGVGGLSGRPKKKCGAFSFQTNNKLNEGVDS